MKSKLKHVIMLNIFIGNYSGIRKFSFGILVIIDSHYTCKENVEIRKKAITLQHIFWHLNIIYLIIAILDL